MRTFLDLCIADFTRRRFPSTIDPANDLASIPHRGRHDDCNNAALVQIPLSSHGTGIRWASAHACMTAVAAAVGSHGVFAFFAPLSGCLADAVTGITFDLSIADRASIDRNIAGLDAMPIPTFRLLSELRRLALFTDTSANLLVAGLFSTTVIHTVSLVIWFCDGAFPRCIFFPARSLARFAVACALWPSLPPLALLPVSFCCQFPV